jgi:hypothetical protein
MICTDRPERGDRGDRGERGGDRGGDRSTFGDRSDRGPRNDRPSSRPEDGNKGMDNTHNACWLLPLSQIQKIQIANYISNMFPFVHQLIGQLDCVQLATTERPKLNLAKRSTEDATRVPAPADYTKAKSNPFGSAKPRDESEIQKRKVILN